MWTIAAGDAPGPAAEALRALALAARPRLPTAGDLRAWKETHERELGVRLSGPFTPRSAHRP